MTVQLIMDGLNFGGRKIVFLSSKTIGNERGISCCFRQPFADSHCNQLHGYPLGFRFIFGARELDERNWVIDFGPNGFGKIRKWVETTFDHKLILDYNDPKFDEIFALQNLGVASITVLDGVGCENFAWHTWRMAEDIIDNQTDGRCWVDSVEVFEHAANSGIYVHPLSHKYRELYAST